MKFEAKLPPGMSQWEFQCSRSRVQVSKRFNRSLGLGFAFGIWTRHVVEVSLL